MMEVTNNTKVFYNTEIPSDWEVCTLGSLADKKKKWSFTGGPFGSNLKAEDYTETGIRIIQLQNIGDGEFLDNYKIFTSVKKADELLSCNIYPGEIILSKMGDPVARGCFIPNEDKRYLMASDGIRVLPDSSRVDSFYLLSFINYSIFRMEAIKISTGSTRQRIGLDDLKSIKIPLPSLPEQKEIAHVLSTADAAIHTTEKLIIQKEFCKKWLMQQLLTGKKRLMGFSREWKEIKLGKVIEICSSKRVLEEDWKVEGVPFYRTREIIKLSNNEELKSPIFITESLFEELKSKYGVPKPNDILVTGVGTIGETYIVKTEDRFYFKDGNVIWFKMNEKINSSFLSQLFKTVFVRKQLLDNASITTVATFTIEGAKNTKIKLPSIEEQNVIAQVLQAADKEISLLKNKVEKMREQKKGLMQQLLTGKVRLNINHLK